MNWPLKSLKALAEQYPRYGYCLLRGMLKNEGLVTNRKRTYRIYTHLGLQVRSKRRKKGTDKLTRRLAIIAK